MLTGIGIQLYGGWGCRGLRRGGGGCRDVGEGGG